MAAGAKQKAIGFFRREPVLVISFVCAAASMAFVPPSEAYGAYFDWKVLSLLFCLMAVVAGFRSLGVLDAAGAWLVARARTQRAVAGVLVGLAFFASMAVTNDVALITFVPLALVVLRRAGMEGRMCLVATLMTIAANLGCSRPWAIRRTCTCSRPRAWVWGSFSSSWGRIPLLQVRCWCSRACCVFEAAKCAARVALADLHYRVVLRPMTPPVIQRCKFRLRAGRPRKATRLIL